MKVLTCSEFDATDPNLCITQAWVEQASLLPELTAEEGAQIGLAFFGLMALAYIFKTLFRNARNS